MALIQRKHLIKRLDRALRRSPVVALLGPRQCGKTTLAAYLAQGRNATRFDLESPRDDARLRNPQTVLEAQRGLIILDEIQRRPDILPLLRVLADRPRAPARFLLLGSASPELMKHSSETLAGRVEFIQIGGFTVEETPVDQQQALWLRGGFPRSFLARTNADSLAWRENFIATFLERDIPQLGVHIPAVQLRRFLTMVAHLHGAIWNASEIGGSLGLTHPTTRRYLDLLSGAFMLRQLAPWFENTGKRVIKSPKIYIRDSGLLHALLNIDSLSALQSHPKLGASWEGFAMEQVLRRIGERDSYFWATHAGAELDLLVIRKGKRWGFEFKASEAPTLTKSMRISLKDLQLEHLWVVYPGRHRYSPDKGISVIPLEEAGRELQIV